MSCNILQLDLDFQIFVSRCFTCWKSAYDGGLYDHCQLCCCCRCARSCLLRSTRRLNKSGAPLRSVGVNSAEFLLKFRNNQKRHKKVATEWLTSFFFTRAKVGGRAFEILVAPSKEPSERRKGEKAKNHRLPVLVCVCCWVLLSFI